MYDPCGDVLGIFLTNKDDSVVFVPLCPQGCSLPCLNNSHAGCTLDKEP